jgi:hypothetical protein
MRALAKRWNTEGNAAFRERKKQTPQESGIRNPNATITLLMRLNGVFWTAACLRMPALNTRQGRRDRDEFLHFVLLRPHDITSDGHVAVLGC